MATYKNIVCTDTSELCTLSGRTFTKDVSGFAICGYYYNTSGYTGPIVVSPTQSVAHYQPGNTGSNDYVEVNGIKWYYTVDGYFVNGNRDATSGNYTLKLGSFSNARDCATYLVNIYYDLISTSVKPTGTGTVSVSYNNEIAIVLANANGGYAFDFWELEDFVELDYITFPKGAYIDTGIIPTNHQTEIKLTDPSYVNDKHWLGTDKGANYYHFTTYSNRYYWAVSGGERNGGSYSSGNHTLIYNGENNSVVLDGNTLGSGVNISGISNLYIGRRETTANFVGSVEYCKITDKSTNALVGNFIPAKRVSTNEIGLLNLINLKFYGNNGTGTFNYGQELGTITFNDNPLSFIVTDDVSLIANFKISYQITLTYDSSLGSALYSWSGSDVVLVATPNANAQFIGWYINSNPIGTTETLTYTPLADTTIEARFGEVYQISDSVVGNGSLQYTRGSDKNDVTFSVIADVNNHFVSYEVNGVEYTTTPLTLHLTEDISIVANFEENERYHIDVSSSFPYATFYISDNDVFSGTYVTIWARPFPDYNFVRWADGSIENPRQIYVTNDVTMSAEYQRTLVTNGIYQYRCYVKDQLDLEAPPKAFMVVDNFDVKTDNMTNANSTINVIETAQNINNGDVLVLYDPFGNTLYQGVIKSIDVKKIQCSQMQSFYKGTWIYNVSPQDYLEHEIAVLLQDYADGKIYQSTYVDNLVAQRLGGITIDYVGTTSANLPTDTDDNGNEKLTQKDMEKFIYELYEDYGIIFDFEINFSGRNYVHIKIPTFTPLKVGNNMYAISNMSPITKIEETNRLIIYAQDKTYKTTYVATKNGIVEEPTSTTNRFDITNTKVVFSDDPVEDLVAKYLPSQMYNHKLTFTLIIKNFIYEFGDFNLGGELEVWFNDDYYNTILTGYQIKKKSNQNISQVDFVCGKVRTALTKQMTMGVV